MGLCVSPPLELLSCDEERFIDLDRADLRVGEPARQARHIEAIASDLDRQLVIERTTPSTRLLTVANALLAECRSAQKVVVRRRVDQVRRACAAGEVDMRSAHTGQMPRARIDRIRYSRGVC
jgi:hypothetical protein